MSIYDKKTFDNALEDIFNQNIFGERKNTSKKSESDYITFVIQEEEGGFVKSINRALKSINKKDFEEALMYLHTAMKSKDKQDFEGFTELTNMFSEFIPRGLKQIYQMTAEIKQYLSDSKIKTNSLIAREFYFEESETFGKNISGTIKSILSNDLTRASRMLSLALTQIQKGNQDDFDLKQFNNLINLIKVVDKVNRLKIVDALEYINYETQNLIDVLKNYKKITNDDKKMLENFKKIVEHIESRGIEGYLYEALKSHISRLMKSETDNSANTKILKNSIKGFKSFLIERNIINRK
jgi:hypothetical protein